MPHADPIKRAEYAREYRLKHKEKIQERQAAWTKQDRQKNPDKYRKYKREYRKRDHVRQYDKEYNRKYYLEHSEQIDQYHKEYHRKYYLENKERLQAQMKEYREAHKEELIAKRRLKYEQHKHKYRAWWYSRKYGISLEQFDQMIAAQDGKCAICLTPFADLARRPDVDHNHITGALRGLLCNSCNTSLGGFGDSAERLRAAADYLDRYANTEAPVETADGIQATL